jgi:hypothetical protein
VKLASSDGTAIELIPRGYQFPAAEGAGDWDDANWLRITSAVSLPSGRRWSTTDPCLTTWEARRLALWMRGVLSGDVAPAPFPGGDEDLLTFTEPNLGLSLAGRSDDVVRVRVHFSLESLPPGLQDADADLYEYFVEVSVTLDELNDAPTSWERELEAFPER